MSQKEIFFVRKYFYPLCLGALCAAGAAVLYQLGKQWIPLGQIEGILPGHDVYFYPEKMKESIWYLALVPGLFAIFCSLLLVRKKFPKPDKLSDKQLLWGLCSLSAFALGVSFASPTAPYFQHLAYASALVLLAGWCYASSPKIRQSVHQVQEYWGGTPGLRSAASRIWTSVKLLLLVCAIGLIFWFIKPFVFEQPHLLVEFPAIPAQTILLGEKIDTLDFIKHHPVLGDWAEDPDAIVLREFIQANEYDIIAAVLDRFVIHHHAHMLNPAFELAQGRPIHQIFAQYGLGGAWIMKELMQAAGGINWQNYFKVLFSFYYIYYALFLAALWLVFKKLNYVLLGALGIVGTLGIYGFVSLWVAPGANPIRHFFDVFVFICLFYYFKTNHRRWVGASALLIILAGLNCLSTGAALLIAAGAALFVRTLQAYAPQRVVTEAVCLSIAVAGLAGIWFFLPTADTSTVGYFLQGMLGFMMTPGATLFLVASLIAGYVIYWFFSSKNTPYAPLFLFSFFYMQGMLFYYVWGSDLRHLMVVFPLCFLAALCALKLAEESISPRANRRIFLLLLVTAILFTWNGFKKYRQEKQAIQHSFEGHVLHQWQLPNARFTSAMDPAQIEQSVRLIEKFAQHDTGIYMISQYDLFLPFLADKYNAMPFISLLWGTTSQKELNEITVLLQTEKPKYLFVDTDIEKALPYADIPANSTYFKNLSADAWGRKQRYQILHKIFQTVRKNYQPIEQGELISAYERMD